MSKSREQMVIDYVARQEEHHRQVSFDDEMRWLHRLHDADADSGSDD